MALNSTVEAPSGMSRSGGRVGVVGITIMVPGVAKPGRRFLTSARISRPVFASSGVMRAASAKGSLIAAKGIAPGVELFADHVHVLRNGQRAVYPVEHPPDLFVDAGLGA